MQSGNVAAVILAAGGSSRFGRAKQLLEIDGKTLIRRAVDAAVEANCWPVLVIIGNEPDKVRGELDGTRAVTVENRNWKRGIGTSIRAGIQHLLSSAPEIKGALLLVADQPFVNATVIKQLIQLREQTGKSIVAAGYSGTLGVPALFDRACFKELLAVNDSNGAKSIILSDPNRVAEFAFPQGAIDIDTADDWKQVTADPVSE